MLCCLTSVFLSFCLRSLLGETLDFWQQGRNKELLMSKIKKTGPQNNAAPVNIWLDWFIALVFWWTCVGNKEVCLYPSATQPSSLSRPHSGCNNWTELLVLTTIPEGKKQSILLLDLPEDIAKLQCLNLSQEVWKILFQDPVLVHQPQTMWSDEAWETHWYSMQIYISFFHYWGGNDPEPGLFLAFRQTLFKIKPNHIQGVLFSFS